MQLASLIQKYLYPPIHTTQDFLLCLGRNLLSYFSLSQVQEILSDYQEYLATGLERGAAEESLLQSMDAPKYIARTIWMESPERKAFPFRKSTLRWMQLLIAALLFFCFSTRLYSYPLYIAAILLFLSAASLSCFGLLHGWERLALERRFGAAPALPRPTELLLLLFPAAAVVLMELLMQKLLSLPAYTIPSHIAGISIGTVCSQIFLILLLLTAILALWALYQTWRKSVRYYPAAIHALGAFLALRDMHGVLIRMDLAGAGRNAFLSSLLFYFAGLFSTLLVAALGSRALGRSFGPKEAQ